MHFGENQLSRSLIGLSPLPTAHPLHFQLKWVRSSTTSYRRFNLAMGRSLRFGSRSRHCNALFRLAFATASPHGLTSRRNTNSQAHSSKGTPSREQSPLRRLVGTRFQVLFHSPPGVLFTFPSRYLSAIGHRVVFRLARWSWRIRTGFLGPRATWDTLRAVPCISSTGPTPSAARHSNLFDYARAPTSPVRQNWYGKSRNPGHATPAGYHTWTGLAFVRVRSPLLTESLLFSLPAGTEMFHFPAFPPHTLCVQAAVTAHDMRRGFPIRTSWDHRPVIDSPRLIADSHVLHRLPMPRHPPCALKNLTTNDQDELKSKEPEPGKPGPGSSRIAFLKMLASTMQFSNNNPVAAGRPAHAERPGPAREP